ncbi:HNH endonuclease [Bacillus toyonensis]|uniref:HNH endonuclease n=1 Tax=Bacillus toyonensis TaxID=155322 RepID=UPI001EDE140E|nr:HNH endonuclease [Bacillus toyonensis]UKS61506.1 HNH endonuclease [Bacillus toyonensis]
MKVEKYFGDERLRHRVVYSKSSYTECIYCGKESDTREHIPSKVFLNRPFPENLSTVSACLTCNNSYSSDEVLLALLIQLLKQKHYGSEYTFSEEVNSRMENVRNVKLVSKIKQVIEADNVKGKFHDSILRVLIKLAIGHSVWDISEGYYIDEDGITTDSAKVEYSFINDMTDEEINEFLSPFDITNEPLPELGSRVYEGRLLVLERDGEEPRLLLDWATVQPYEYNYTCYQFGDEIVVKMVINSFLFAEVTLCESHS